MVGHGGGRVAFEVDELAEEVIGAIAGGAIVEILPVEARVAIGGLDPVRERPESHARATVMVSVQGQRREVLIKKARGSAGGHGAKTRSHGAARDSDSRANNKAKPVSIERRPRQRQRQRQRLLADGRAKEALEECTGRWRCIPEPRRGEVDGVDEEEEPPRSRRYLAVNAGASDL
ncbi:hypothetical protein G7046_g1048 [Stylonectria norvegica]|nr:hypothetical protein G7046_g1048 [Stylonectria norvegica]